MKQYLADQAKRARVFVALDKWPVVCEICGKKPALVKDVTVAGHTRRRLKVYSCVQCHAARGITVSLADYLTAGQIA